MPGWIPPLPTEASGALELNRWQGVRTEPSLSERIDGHVPYPGPPPAYDVENYARFVQWAINSAVAAVALQSEHRGYVVTITGVGSNTRRISINGTNIDYADQPGDTVATVTQAFVDLINDNATVTAGANAVQATYITAGALAIASIAAGTTPTLTVVASVVVSDGGSIAESSLGTPDIVIPLAVLSATTGNIVLGAAAKDVGAFNDTRLVLNRTTRAVRIGTVNGTEWDTPNNDSIAIGTNAQANVANTVALGRNTTADDAYDVAIGDGASANGNASGATALGRNANASNNVGTAIGGNSAASGTNSTALGSAATASAANALAAGASASATAQDSVALGSSSSATAQGAVALGDATASGAGAVAIGVGAVASAANANAIGGNVAASGAGALATGANGANILDPKIQATGKGSRAHGGPSTTASSGELSIVASGLEANAMGEGCHATGDYSDATGYGAVAGNRGESARASYGIDASALTDGAGAHQAGQLIVQTQTSGNVTQRLRTDALASATGTTWTPMDDRAYYVRLRLVAKKADAQVCEVFVAEGVAAVDAGVAAIGAALTFGASVDNIGAPGLASPVIAASGAGINIDVTGVTAEAWVWTCEICYVQAGTNY